MEWVFFWLLCAGVVAFLAHRKGRDAVRWFFIAVLISPLIAFIILLIAPDLQKEREKVEAAALRTPCPFCSEPIMKTARVCPHCRSDVSTPSPAAKAEPTVQTPTPAQRPSPLPPPTPRPSGSSPFAQSPRRS
jgi:hypothetical protein